MAMLRAIVKRPDEQYGHMTNVSNRLETMQKTVEGYIETITLDGKVVIICDEEGRLKGSPYNCTVAGIPFVGTIVAIGYDGKGEFADLPISMKDWKQNYLEVR